MHFISPNFYPFLPEGQRSRECLVFALRHFSGVEDPLHPPQVRNYMLNYLTFSVIIEHCITAMIPSHDLWPPFTRITGWLLIKAALIIKNLLCR